MATSSSGTDRGEHRGRHGRARDGRHLQQIATGRGEPVKAQAQRVAARHPGSARRVGEQSSARHHQPGQLAHEQRVAAAAPTDGLGQLGLRHGACDLGHQRGDTVGVQTDQRQARRAGRERPQRGHGLLVPVGSQQQDPLGDERAVQEVEQAQRVGVGDCRSSSDDQQRRGGRQRRADGVEQPEPVVAGPPAHRLPGPAAARRPATASSARPRSTWVHSQYGGAPAAQPRAAHHPDPGGARAAACSASSADLPMPGSPMTSRSPPAPATASSSAAPVTARPRPGRRAVRPRALRGPDRGHQGAIIDQSGPQLQHQVERRGRRSGGGSV